MRTPATPYDQDEAAGNPPASTSAAEGAPGASVGAGIADRLFSAFTSFYQGLCWCLAVSAALLGYAGPVTGLDWEIFLVWQGFMIIVHSGCIVARLWQGLPPLPTGTITKVICMSFTPGLSEPLDALRDPIVAVVFLQYGLTVGYLSAALTLLAVVSSTIVSLQDTHAFEEHKMCSPWALYFLPVEAVGSATSDGDAGELWTYTPANTLTITTRKVPEIDGERTLKTLRPFDMFRVTEERKIGEVTFLRLAGGEGWLFDTKPNVGLMCTKGEVGQATSWHRDAESSSAGSSYFREASKRMATAAASKTSPLHQNLVIYEEVPQGLAILLFSLFGKKSSFVLAVGTITATKVIMTLVVRPYLLAWQSMYSTWASVSPRDIERTVRVKCIGSAHLAGCCSSVASDCKQHPDTRAAALHGLRKLLGRGDVFEIDQDKLREVLTSKTVLQFNYLLAKDVAEPLFQDSDQLERNFGTARRLHGAGELGVDDACRIIDEMTPEMFVYWPLEPHIQALCHHASETVRSAASKAMQGLRKVLSERRVPVAAAEVQAMPGQRFEGEGGQVHYEPGDKGAVVSDAFVDAEGNLRIKVSWYRAGLTNVEFVKDWTERFKLVGRVYFSVGDVVEAVPGQRLEVQGRVYYEPGDKGRVCTEPYLSSYGEREGIDLIWSRSGLKSFSELTDCMKNLRIVERAPSLSAGHEVEALPGQRFEGKKLCPPPGKEDEGKGVVFYEPGDTGRVSSQYKNVDKETCIKVTWYRSGLTTDQSMTSWMDTFKIVGPPHSLSVGDEVEALPGSRAERAEGTVHEPGDRGAVVRLSDGDEHILVIWYKTGLRGDEHVNAWMQRLRFVGKARVPSLGDEVVLGGNRFENSRGVVFYEPGDKGKVSTEPCVDGDGDEVIDIVWSRTGKISISEVSKLLQEFRVVEAAGDAPGAQ